MKCEKETANREKEPEMKDVTERNKEKICYVHTCACAVPNHSDSMLKTPVLSEFHSVTCDQICKSVSKLLCDQSYFKTIVFKPLYKKIWQTFQATVCFICRM